MNQSCCEVSYYGLGTQDSTLEDGGNESAFLEVSYVLERALSIPKIRTVILSSGVKVLRPPLLHFQILQMLDRRKPFRPSDFSGEQRITVTLNLIRRKILRHKTNSDSR